MSKVEVVAEWKRGRFIYHILDDDKNEKKFETVIKCENCELDGTMKCQCKYKRATGLELINMFNPGFKEEMMNKMKEDFKKK